MSGIVGSRISRVDGREKVTGRTKYVADMTVPGMTYGAVLRSPVPHARIARIETQAAESLPGVVSVLTGRDLLDIDPYYGHALRDRPVVAMDRVRFAGEPVAVVAAEDEATAAEAVRLIDVEYEELEVVATLDEALRDGAPLLHEGPLRPGLFHGLGQLGPREGNICYRYRFARGDVAAAFARADVVVEGEYTFPMVYQYAMEPHAVIAQYGPEGITVWATCQHPYMVRAELAAIYQLPLDAVRVIVPFLGGGFGSKSYTKVEPITVAIARKARRPVRIVNRVDEAMVTTRRHNMRCTMRTAATAAGRLLARECVFWLDTGAYADNGPRVTATAGDAAPGPYRWQAVSVDGACVYTNTGPAGSYRAFGATHLQWIGEAQVDEIARRLGIDRVEFRQRNLLRPGEEVRPGGKPLDADLIGDVTKVAAAINWGAPKAPWVGRGVSVGLLAAGANPVSNATVRLQVDGTLTVLGSTTEMGQGARTAFSQIAAEELGLPIERVRIVNADTHFTPYDRSTGASRSTTIAGLAVKRAADEVRQQLLEIAGRIWGLPLHALEIRDGAVWHETDSVSFEDLIARHFGMRGGELIGRGEVRPETGSGSYAEGPIFWEVCVGGAEVEVDPETGRVHVRRLASIADVGKAINPTLVETQDEGACLQGLGNALFEEMIYDHGQLVNNNLLDYRIPTTEDIPDSFISIIVENADGPGPYGAKGVGEGALAAVPAAIVNALADAGVPMDELPLTPERVWAKIQKLSGRTR